ncbi:MAG TPA: L-serine ammonia-lyase [Acetobacteraceae bacterium]|nr:L-serine ammonia-lyase [Acetobacteraceae bacterium]
MISIFELFKIGIGPSSSHTVGPMRAAAAFVAGLRERGVLAQVGSLRVTLFGSLAWTGRGHGTGKAVVLGLAGEAPETVDPDAADALVAQIGEKGTLDLGGRNIHFNPDADIIFDVIGEAPVHPNTLMFTACGSDGAVLAEERWCSVGGGFVVREREVGATSLDGPAVPHPFRSAAALLELCSAHRLSIADLVFANECALRPAAQVERYVARVAATMESCVERGMRGDGELPGGLRVRRRAAALRERIEADEHRNRRSPHELMDHVSLFAIAVNEENAAGGRVVTAPTNGAAGVVPAVLRYYRTMTPDATEEGVRRFLLTATAIGALFKMNASISGAEVGCQGEVGVASSMAAAGLAAALGATDAQVENAAEIAMEHHLGMTCDPVGGLVQIPCIERNAFGAMKAITAASLAMRGDGTHRVSLDQVIATMRQTGADMQSKYKETSLGGLAVNFTEC